MVVPEKPAAQAPISAVQALSQASVFRIALAKGARVVASTLRQVDIDTILASCVEQDPILLRVQQESIRNPKIDIGALIEEGLGYYEKDSMQRHFIPYQTRVRSLEAALKNKNSHIADLSDVNEQIGQQLAYTQGEQSKTRQQLQQIQQEYASLRSKLQLHENTEQGDVVQTLKDLNRGIDDLGRSVSEHLVDTYVEVVFGKEAGDVTTLDARNLPDLKGLLGHADGSSSLVVSSDGVGMPVEDFLDYAIRMLLCERLCRRIFDRFHPAAELFQDQTAAAMYEDVQRRGECTVLAKYRSHSLIAGFSKEPQAVAAKWRSNSFKSIYKGEDADAVTHHINLITQEVIDECLTPLVAHLFGQEAGVKLSDQCPDHLRGLVRSAWDWNSVLKGEIIMLGDFRLVYYAPSCQFEPDLMTEFEPNRRNPEPRSVAGTLGLGLLSFRAVGGGEMPEKTVVCKAMVATESLYA
ncbi:hypothetical protein FRC10_007907 [Ceratobasidium sp. 414]|nr:hypothetical protein FRC10_007907 [Ceratobasidium sp. 414]